MMSLGMVEGEEVSVTAEGDDEKEAIAELVNLLGE